MHILTAITTYPPSTGGAQLHQHLLLQQLQHRHNVQVVSQWDRNRTDWLLGTTLRAPEQSCNYAIDGINVHRLGLSKWEKASLTPYVPIYYPLMRHALPPIAACLERHLYPYAARADLIHNVRIGREGLSYAAFQVARHRNIPFVLTPVHHPRWVGWRYRAYNQLYTLADAVFALTNSEKQTFIQLGVKEERITVIGHGPVLANEVDADSFRQKHHIDGPMVLFLGQHYEYKGYRQLLEAAPLIWRKIPEAHLVFIGPPVENSEVIFRTAADPRIHRLGNVDLQTKTDALAASTLLCVPSTQESFGGVYCEAWSFAKPVIGCNIPTVAEVISDGIDGYIVEQKGGEIADRICQLLLDTGTARHMGAAGKQKVEERYTWPRIAARAEDGYRRVLASGR